MSNNYIDNQEVKKKSKKLKLIKNKKWMAAIVATSLLVGSGAIKLYQIRKENDERNANSEYMVGYDDINLFTNFITKRVGENNFVLLNIKDHDSISIFLQKLKLDYCEEKCIDIGLIIDTNSSTLGDVYLDLEYLLSVMTEYKINCPVYLNVDSFMENDKLSLDDATRYIECFLEKAAINNLYVGVIGSENNIGGKFDKYDKLVLNSISDSEGMIFEDNGIYYANKELNGYIEDNYFNYPGLFRDDEYYICEGNETLRSIANQFGISVNDLMKFNDIKDEEIVSGTIFRIPSEVQSYNPSLSFVEDNFYKGIDVSSWQGEINWDIIDVDYAIIKVKDFINKGNDSQFKNNVLGCSRNHIPMGFYSFSRATSVSQIKEEAQYIIEQLYDVNVTYPVYLDLETDFWTFKVDANGQKILDGMTFEETKMFVLDVLKTWEKEFTRAGYIPGIYCGNTLYQDLNEISDGYINKLAVWVAGGKYYDKEVNFNDKEDVPIIKMDNNVGMKQISSKGVLDGIYNETGEYVDINYCYMDYEKYRPYRWDRMKFPNYHYDVDFVDGLIPLGLGMGAGIILEKVHHHKKVRKRKKANK